MFQDEARFGRMVRIRRCWAPAPQRPVVDNGYEREFQYVYGAVSPLEGELDWSICPAMNTEHMGSFLAQVSAAHPQDFIVMWLAAALFVVNCRRETCTKTCTKVVKSD